MSKYKILTFITLAFLSVSLTACTLFTKPSDTNTPQDSKKTAPESKSITGKLGDLLSMNAALVCDSSMTVEGSASKTKTFVSGNKMRADTTTVTGDTTLDSHIVSDGEWIYIWGTDEKNPNQGLKFKYGGVDSLADSLKDFASDLPETANTDTTEDPTPDVDKMDYNCNPWVVDNSMFTAPEGITFTDMDQTMKDMTEKMQTLPSTGNLDMNNKCSICDMIPDASDKAECKKQFTCN